MKNSIKALLLTVAAALFAVLPSACVDNNVGSGEGTTPVATESAAADTDVTVQENEAPEAGTDTETDTEAASETGEEAESDLWKDAKYTEDTKLGDGAVTINVKVVAEGKTVTFTVHTDKDMLGAALVENELVSGEESEYGMYIKFANGMEADYDKNGAYWALSKDGEYLMTGADSTPIADGENYELTYTKG